MYEIAQAILDLLQFPVWGRAGDAADRLSAFVMQHFGEDLAIQTVTATAMFFDATKKTWTGSAFADVNSPEEQRFYNYLCIAYGGSPISFRFLVDQQPTIRIRSCPGRAPGDAPANTSKSARPSICGSCRYVDPELAGGGQIAGVAAAERHEMIDESTASCVFCADGSCHETCDMSACDFWHFALAWMGLSCAPAYCADDRRSTARLSINYYPPKSLKYVATAGAPEAIPVSRAIEPVLLAVAAAA